jgi:thioredoxin reductase (NADPH)
MEQVVILGSGPAGLTAAIYAARAFLKPLVIDGLTPGGQLMITTDVENFPGFPEMVTGPDLIERIRKQAERFETRFKDGIVTGIDTTKKPFIISFESGETIETQTIIVATGASARWLGLESETALRGAGVSACATCDGFFFTDKEVLVVGGGDTAMEEASYLTHHCSKVTVVHRRDELRASQAMQDRARQNKKIEFIWDSAIEEIKDVSAGRVTSAVLRNLKTNETSEVTCDGVFLAIGHIPNTQFLKENKDFKLDEHGFIVKHPYTTETSIAGIFVAGDVADNRYRQGISAAGTGCMAAIDAERYLGGEPPSIERDD